MTITCPYCRKQHRLPEGFLPAPRSATRCKSCGRRFILARDGNIPPQWQALAVASEAPAASPPPARTGTATAEGPAPHEQGSGNSPVWTSAIGQAFPGLLPFLPENFLEAGIFQPDKRGRYLTKRNHHKAKLLQAVSPLLLDRILQGGEKVCHIASGIAYFPSEIPYANGLLTWPLNYYALVATTRRLLLINLDYHLTHPNRYVFQVPYGEISSVSRGFYGSSVIVMTHAGRRWDFTTVQRASAVELTEFIENLLVDRDDSPSETDNRQQLCPACFQPVPERVPGCPYCLTPYKSAGDAIRKSLLLPGLGSYYLSYPSLAIAELLGYLLTWLITVVLVIIGIPGGILGGGLLVLAYHLLAAFMAGQMARKGYLPEYLPGEEYPPETEPDEEELMSTPAASG